MSKKPPCPNLAEHTRCPTGYLQWHAWAEARKKRGFTQHRCNGCGRWVIWKPPER